jgi:hypothetical protein
LNQLTRARSPRSRRVAFASTGTRGSRLQALSRSGSNCS